MASPGQYDNKLEVKHDQKKPTKLGVIPLAEGQQ